jgi:hypothetical protein
MAEQDVQFVYRKSPQWRVAYATGAVISTLGGPTGNQTVLHFTNEWTGVERETFKAEVNGGEMRVTQNSELVLGQLFKLEEVAVTMTPAAAAGLCLALISQAHNFPAEAVNAIRTAVTNMTAA